MTLYYFNDPAVPVISAAQEFFREQLGLTLRPDSFRPLPAADIFPDPVAALSDALTLLAPDGLFFLGTVDEQVVQPAATGQGYLFAGSAVPTLDESITRYGNTSTTRKGILLFGLELTAVPTRTQLAAFSRALNHRSKLAPVMVVARYPNPDYNPAAIQTEPAASRSLVSLATSERSAYQQEREGRAGEKVGRVALLRDMRALNTHEGNLRILRRLVPVRSGPGAVRSFSDLYVQWKRVFDVSVLNKEFYKDLTTWYYAALPELKLPFKLEHETPENNKKSFLIRLLSRTLFAWFLKEKGLIPRPLLELEDHLGNRYELLRDQATNDFGKSNSYFRGVLQNVFFRALNQETKARASDFTCTQYLAPGFDFKLFAQIPYLNGGIFDELLEDNCKATIEDTVLGIPNLLFYGLPAKGKKPAREGLNQLLNRYAFTIEENTPAEEVIALDPELLGLVFESLLAELDPDLKADVRKSIRSLTGSFYTPRKVIQEMVNESLFLYLNRHFRERESSATAGQLCPTYGPRLHQLIYHNQLDTNDTAFCQAVVVSLDDLKVLDPACGSGAFPMGMLQRVVQLLQLLDPLNDYWLDSQLSRITDPNLRERARQELRGQYDNYSRKLGIIKNCIYGLDIQPLAVQITKLRFFITLLIDQKIEEGKHNRGISPMPNLETKIVCANSLQDVNSTGFIFNADVADRLQAAHAAYYQPHLTRAAKKGISKQIVDILENAFPDFARDVTGGEENAEARNRELLKDWFEHATVAAPFFSLDAFFPELIQRGFDIVLGNPPYGGTPISQKVKKGLGLGSTDPYGAFMARFLGDGSDVRTPLRVGGVLAFIVSDTFMTIGSHLKLREKMLRNYVHKMIRLHPKTFGATVNTVIVLAERNQFTTQARAIPDTHRCQLVDLTNYNLHDEEGHRQFLRVLHHTEGFGLAGRPEAEATDKHAIYHYPQQLIRTNSNLPFFVASPKLFELMNDRGNNSKKEYLNINSVELVSRIVKLNNEEAFVIRFGSIADAPHGISTGDNKAYVRVKPGTRGGYSEIEDWMICSEKEMLNLTDEEKVRGLKKDWKKLESCFVPFEKGGESDPNSGWLPNYYVPTQYYINWAQGSVQSMSNNPGFAWKNERFFFKKGLTFSISGVYAPTFRFNSSGVFEAKGSGIFCDVYSDELLLGVLSSRLAKYIFKNYIKHSVDTSGDDITAFPFLVIDEKSRVAKDIITYVSDIIEKQKSTPRYDYAQNEQLEIDRLVYEAYGLNAADIAEVENWYARRYPRLVRPAADPASAATPAPSIV
jgi:type I restriction-modification system DNA methylase subunit